MSQTCCPAGLADLVKHPIYVGLADHTLAVLQHGTGLFLADLQRLTQDMFFQQVGSDASMQFAVHICGSVQASARLRTSHT